MCNIAYSPTLSRSLKLWMVLRLYGLEGLRSHIRNHIELAAYFEELVGQDTRFKVFFLLGKTPFLVSSFKCIRKIINGLSNPI